MVIGRRFLIEADLVQVKAEITDILNRVKQARPGFTCDIRNLLTDR